MAAANGSVTEVGVALGESGDARTDFLNPTGVLVTEDERWFHETTVGIRFEVVEDRNVRVAGTRAGDLQEHLPRARSGLLHLFENGEFLERFDDNCLQHCSLRYKNNLIGSGLRPGK